MKVFAVVCLFVVSTGCASHGNVVRCDGRLVPVNQPASPPQNAAAKRSEAPLHRQESAR